LAELLPPAPGLPPARSTPGRSRELTQISWFSHRRLPRRQQGAGHRVPRAGKQRLSRPSEPSLLAEPGSAPLPPARLLRAPRARLTLRRGREAKRRSRPFATQRMLS